MAKRKNAKSRNFIAKDVRTNPLYRKRIVPSDKLYSRNPKHKLRKDDTTYG